jgi:RNA polymerase sigma-70 factor (ECF subfamily)
MSSPIIPDSAAAEPLSDEEVVRRVRAGERDLYELLLRRHNQRVYRAVRAVLRDEDEVEDVMQQAYVSAYLHLDQFAGMARFSTWLVRIAVNEAFARAGRSRRLVLVGAPGRDDVGANDQAGDHVRQEGQVSMSRAAGGRTPEDEVGSREMVALVERALDGLPEAYRTVLVLREIEGLSTAEAATVLGTSEEVIRTRLHRARTLLQARVQATTRDLTGAFPFDARRCDRVVAAVMAALAARG